ncbi:hypothetical protein D9Q98_008576 [Chlorella vulgaris]|uniref:Uncharacterized protein n=1 Tax=Chlorella vulgaris TaxID=3077 RepID=A0A9D4TI65_CHLVU|nr:hypothetical protein D9Q98_008576 [Chlorella vulgaris]
MSKASTIAGWAFGLAFWLSLSGSILVLCGLAALQNMCDDVPLIPMRRRLLQLPPFLTSTCALAYSFQWWGWALQTAFLALTTAYYVARFKSSGVMIMGGCATVLAMQFANDQLLGMDTASGKAFSRATVTFVGWLLACTGNFGMMVASAHLEAPSPCTKGDAQCPAAAAKATQAETATEVAASTA